MASAASDAERLPLNELGATMIFIPSRRMPCGALGRIHSGRHPSLHFPDASQRGRGEERARGGGHLSPPRLINRNCPVLIFRCLATDGAEIDVLQLLRELPNLAIAHGPSVDLVDGRDLSAGSAEEQLVARVELGAVDAPLHDILA